MVRKLIDLTPDQLEEFIDGLVKLSAPQLAAISRECARILVQRMDRGELKFNPEKREVAERIVKAFRAFLEDSVIR